MNFALEAAKPRLDLGRAVAEIARLGNPELDTIGCVGRLDDLAAAASSATIPHSDPADQLDALLRFLCNDFGLRGNAEAYYDPRNSFLDQVLERRLGIPITISVVVIEVGRRLGLEIEGVGFPGHFLIRGPTGRILDPFNGGAVLTLQDLAALLGQERVDERLLRASTKREILARILRNLKNVFIRQREPGLAIAAINRLLLVITDQAIEIRDRGLLLYSSGVLDRAATDLNYYLAYCQGAEDRDAIRATLRKISDRLNLQN